MYDGGVGLAARVFVMISTKVEREDGFLASGWVVGGHARLMLKHLGRRVCQSNIIDDLTSMYIKLSS